MSVRLVDTLRSRVGNFGADLGDLVGKRYGRRRPPIYGMMAEYDSPTDLVAAARTARTSGFTLMDAYSPFPIEELHDAIGFHSTKLPLIVLIGGITGAVAGYLLQYWSQVINYPMNVGGKPIHAWPAFIPPTFETTVLFSAFAAVFGMIALNGLPMPYHPVFNVPEFSRASIDKFFLCIEADDPRFDATGVRQLLESTGARRVTEVPH